jgi:arylsulfatase A-like enzyme
MPAAAPATFGDRSMTIIKSKVSIFTCLLIVSGLIATPGLAHDPRPNILFMMSDDHALEAIGAYNTYLKDSLHTPTLDSLAAQGMRFTNVCCNNSICSPSRASIISGQYSHINGVRGLNQGLKEDSPSYNIELQKAGYQTAVFGKWHMKHTPRGFDDYGVTKGQGSYFNPTFTSPNGVKKYQGYYADVYTDVALDWLKNRDITKPFCLNLQFKGPHHPYDYPPRHEKMLAGKKVPEPVNLHEDVEKTSAFKAKHWGHMVRNRAYYGRHEKELEPHGDTTREKASAAYQHMMHKYIRCVAAIDENIKRVIDYLDEAGIKDNTIIIYTADQGYWLGQHGFYDKRLILEESLKMPLIVRYPAMVKAGAVNDDMISNVDFGPTILDLAGINTPELMQGRSIKPILLGKTPADWRKAIWYAYWPQPHYGVRSKKYKLIRFPGTEQFEFYDMLKDPNEMKNVASDPAYKHAISEMRQLMDLTMQQAKVKKSDLPGKGDEKKPPSDKPKKRRKKGEEK